MELIPTSIKLGGHTIQVIRVPDLVKEQGCWGKWNSEKHEIHLQDWGVHRVTASFIQQTFWHEVTHAILSMMGEEDLNSNEKFVDLFAQFLHQVIETKE